VAALASLSLLCGFSVAALSERIKASQHPIDAPSESTALLAVALPLQRAPFARGCVTLPEIMSAMLRLESDYVFVDDEHVASLSGAGSGNSVVLTKVPCLTTSTTVPEVLSLLRTTGSPVGLVLDDSGATRWFVTLEEVLEQMLFDSGKLPVTTPAHTVEVDGWVTLARLARIGFALPLGEWRSVGGLLSAKAGRIPEAGYSIELHPYRVTVTAATHRAVTRVVLETVL
jgi:CBS domain containing-hemolysin-like protein